MEQELTTLLHKDKKGLTDKQEIFLNALTLTNSETYLDVEGSMAIAEYSSSHKHYLLKALSNEIIERARFTLVSQSLNAGDILFQAMQGTLTGNGKGDKDLRFRAAQDILDRAGVSKKIEKDIHIREEIAVILLPGKDINTENPIDIEFEDISS
jgi:hypothetical protein